MKDEDIPNLVGGYATGTLTDQERQLLFTAALKDQALFDALADEQVLHDLLSDPVSRRRLLESLQPEIPSAFDRLTSWMRRPSAWAAAASVASVMVLAIALQQAPKPMIQMAKSEAVALPSVTAQEQPVREFERKDAPASVASARRAVAAPKMKIAVLDFYSGPPQVKEADSASPDLGRTASDLLGKKLDSRLYEVIDRKQVDQAVQAQKLNERQLEPSAAASVGRSVGADAVIVGSVKPMQLGAISGLRSEARSKASKDKDEEVAVTATAINTQNAATFAFAQRGQAQGAQLTDAVEQVASSLGQQIQVNARLRMDGLVTEVDGKTVTLNVGLTAGIKPGDRLEVRRAGRPIGRVVIQSAQDASSIGLFEGADNIRIGDTVSSQ